MNSSPQTLRAGAARPALLVGVAVVALGAVWAWLRLGAERAPVTDEPTIEVGTLPRTEPEPERSSTPASELAAPQGLKDNRPLRRLYGVCIDDATEEPIQAFVMRAAKETRPVSEAEWEDVWTQRVSSALGRWGMPTLEDGVYTLRFEATGYANAVFEDFEIPTRLEQLVVRMQHGRWFHGQLTKVDGTPVPDFPLRLVPQHRFGSEAEAEAIQATTNEEGYYDFSSVPKAVWAIELAGLEGALREVPLSEEFTTGDDEETVWNPTLPDLSSLQLNVKFKANRWVFAPTEAILETSWGSRLVAPIKADVATFRFLAPGIYTLTIGKVGEDPWHTEVLTVPEETADLVWDREVVLPKRKRPKVDLNRAGQGKGKNRRGGK